MQARPQRSLQVSALGRLGISEFDGDGYVRQSIATIARVLYLGSAMLDTAKAYCPLTNEQLVRATLAHDGARGAT